MGKQAMIVEDSAPVRGISLRGHPRAGIVSTDREDTADGAKRVEGSAGGSFDPILSDVNGRSVNRRDLDAQAARLCTPDPVQEFLGRLLE